MPDSKIVCVCRAGPRCQRRRLHPLPHQDIPMATNYELPHTIFEHWGWWCRMELVVSKSRAYSFSTGWTSSCPKLVPLCICTSDCLESLSLSRKSPPSRSRLWHARAQMHPGVLASSPSAAPPSPPPQAAPFASTRTGAHVAEPCGRAVQHGALLHLPRVGLHHLRGAG